MLVNALAGRDACPVDDAAATATFTAVHRALEDAARLRRLVDGESAVEAIAIEDVWRFATERGSDADRRGVDLVDIDVVGSDLPDGVVLLDAPGAGGLLDQHLAVTLQYLRLADAVVLVTDASRPLTGTELDVAEGARDRCPRARFASASKARFCAAHAAAFARPSATLARREA